MLNFFCNGLTPQTCAAINEWTQSDKSVILDNQAGGDEDMRALEVAVAGMRAGWIPENASALEAASFSSAS